MLRIRDVSMSPCLTWLKPHHHRYVVLVGQQPGVNGNVGFGLQQIFPLICNGPNTEVQRGFLTQDVEG